MTTVEQTSAVVPAPTGVEGPAPGSITTSFIGLLAVAGALLSSTVTFLVLAGFTPIVATANVVATLLYVNGATVIVLVAIIGRDLWNVLQARRRGRAGSRLHVQIVRLFSIVAAIPTILVAIVASITLDRTLDQFFSVSNRLIIQTSLNVAQAYLREHAVTLGDSVMAMSYELNRLKPLHEQDRERFRQVLSAQASLRRLSGVMLVDGEQNLLDKALLPVQREFLAPPKTTLANVTEQEPTVAFDNESSYVAAIVKLRDYDNTYLFVTRMLDPAIVGHLRDTQLNVAEQDQVREIRIRVQIIFALMYTVIALTVLLSAVWIGFNFANRLVAPIRRLITAANVVSTGNLMVQVPVGRSEGDISQLGETFNKMTHELRTQRDDIMRARDLIDSRRLFTEAVLAGASAGVIGVDEDGQINIMNRSAEKLIGCAESEALGRTIPDVAPELAQMVAGVRTGVPRLAQGQVTLIRGGRERTVSVRVTTEQSPSAQHGYVITLDDITELVAAQRTSAWADVARRIAHEIKNPLTPIQLSAERLRRKYGKTITEDRAVFEQCTNTIVRQVDDIRRMVDEFSRFARMPTAVMAAEDVADTVRQAVFLMRVGNADIDLETEIAEDPMPAHFDRRLISQGLTNIIKNATEAISAVPPEELGRGHIHVSAIREGDMIYIDVVDNGIGLPQENRNRLLEPYVTTREKGTGLGLAIVGKILEEHGGGIELHDASEKNPGTRGTWVRMRIAADVKPSSDIESPQSKAAS
jgi:two-component system, NtrC family, nitrogen regulation sensor histidine kinase NtrY